MVSFHRLLTTSAIAMGSLPGLSQAAPQADSSAAAVDFTNHKFWDFRNIANPRVPDPIVGVDQDTAAPLTHPYFSTPEWTDTWGIQSWTTPGQGVFRANSANNIYIQQDTDANPASSTFLTMRTLRHDDYQSTAEFESRTAGYRYLSIRMLARTHGDPGAVTAMFTYKAGNPVQEGDLEIRTSTPTNVVQYTNQPSYDEEGNEFPETTRIVELATPWTGWQEHRYDWTPGSSDWYVDGAKVASIQFQTPVDPLSILFNVWSDGGVWSGVMEPGRQAEMQIQWIDFSYST